MKIVKYFYLIGVLVCGTGLINCMEVEESNNKKEIAFGVYHGKGCCLVREGIWGFRCHCTPAMLELRKTYPGVVGFFDPNGKIVEIEQLTQEKVNSCENVLLGILDNFGNRINAKAKIVKVQLRNSFKGNFWNVVGKSGHIFEIIDGNEVNILALAHSYNLDELSEENIDEKPSSCSIQ